MGPATAEALPALPLPVAIAALVDAESIDRDAPGTVRPTAAGPSRIGRRGR